jgi:hypothetical protein
MFERLNDEYVGVDVGLITGRRRYESLTPDDIRIAVSERHTLCLLVKVPHYDGDCKFREICGIPSGSIFEDSSSLTIRIQLIGGNNPHGVLSLRKSSERPLVGCMWMSG